MVLLATALFFMSVMWVVSAGNYDYAKVLKLSLLFYEAQKSGHLPLHHKIPWRGDSALTDKGLNGEDLSGGFYDTGDFVKFGFTTASTVTLLSWGLLTYEEAYRSAGQYENCLDIIRWAGDYFMKCHVGPNEFYGQVGDWSFDHAFWGRPEDMNMTRPAFKIDQDHPGSDLAGETAASFASMAILFNSTDPKYAALCIEHARQLYSFAKTYKGLYHESIKTAAKYYQSTGYGDELAWAAAWLYRATNETSYLKEAEESYIIYKLDERPTYYSFDKKDVGVQVLLAELTDKDKYKAAAESFCDYTIEKQKRTPLGLVFIDKFGTLCHTANIAFICLQLANLNVSSSQKYFRFAESQIKYILGDSGRSYIVGFGENYPKQPHHSSSSCKDRPAPCGWESFYSPDPNPQIVYGAMVSGPDKNDYFEDVRAEYAFTEVNLDYNGGLQSGVAGLLFWKLRRDIDIKFNVSSLTG